MQRPPRPAAVPPPSRPELPRHVAIIMDGNGRWARRRRLPRIAGHRAGVATIRPVTEECNRLGVHILTLYAFSTENWSRPRTEVAALMRLFSETIDREIDELDAEGIQLRILGRREELGERLQAKIEQAEARTAHNSGNILNVAINYGGRSEIVDAVRDLAERGADLRSLEEADLSRSLYTAGLPDPDLIVRTAGELRISNFLLWQAAYAELYVTETLWPDFGGEDLQHALRAFAERERRFGAIQTPPDPPDEVAPAASHGG
ncbi:MAG: undecaprenyl diphosphate synthase [Chloroflexota bacterium]|nr:undecaprenyl diphosphate synthase [Chloroflexota bacterium]